MIEQLQLPELTLPAEQDGVRDTILNGPPTQDNLILLTWVRTEFNLARSIASLCDAYFMRVWDGEWAIMQVRDGKITYASVEYIVHWQSLPEICRHAPSVGCSFRKYRGKNYVVMKVWDANKAPAPKSIPNS